MKAGKKQLVSGSLEASIDSTDVVKVKRKNQNTAIINLLPVLAMLTVILPGVIRNDQGIDIAKIGILTLILTASTSFYMRFSIENIHRKRFAKSIITIAYLSSICLMTLIVRPEIISFWMIGGLVVAMLIDAKLGLLLHFNLTFLLGITLSLHTETVIQLLVLGVLMSLLSEYLKQKSTVIYAAIILLSTNITLAFTFNNFIFETDSNYNYLSALFSILAVIVTAYLLCMLYEQFLMKNEIAETDITTEDMLDKKGLLNKEGNLINHDGSITKELSLHKGTLTGQAAAMLLQAESEEQLNQAAVLQYKLDARMSYELLNEEGNYLLGKIKEFSQSLYEHSLRIGDISCRAAKVIGADEILAKAGGLYHEVGKINGKNYIEEGLKIAEEYAFPKELQAILRQHNIKYEKPTSVEAAIVMLTDSIVSTIEYIEKTEEHKFTTVKIIDNIFQMRMDKGTFDDSGLSVKNFKKLKDFYLHDLNKSL